MKRWGVEDTTHNADVEHVHSLSLPANKQTMAEFEEWIHEALRRIVDDSDQLSDVSKPEPINSSGNECISTVFTAKARGTSGEILSIFAKALPVEDAPSYSDFRHQFRNECLVYEEFLPFLIATAEGGDGDQISLETIRSLFPKFFGSHEDSTQCVLALENVTPLGFKLAPKLLDLDHVTCSLRWLGAFHALSYIAKKLNPGAFSDLAKRLYPWDEKKCRVFDTLIGGMAQHATESFRAAYPVDGEKHADRLRKLVDVADHFYELTMPEEPLAVLCHSDYNRNNIMFAYGHDSRPVTLKIIDFQLTSYSSPAMDMSMLLFMSTTPEILDANWDELFNTYHTSMLDVMERSLRVPRHLLEEEYSMDIMMKDFRKFGMHSFLVTAFYMPLTIMEPEEFVRFGNDCPAVNTKECLSYSIKFCSEEANSRLASLIKVLINRNII